jgi:general secretion pathway protein C
MIQTLSMIQKRFKHFTNMRGYSLFSVFAAILLVFATVQLARLVWTLLTPVAPLGNWKPDSPQGIPAAQRAALFQQFDPFFRTQNVDTGSETITSLPITLFGIRSNEASGAGSAIIADSAGVQNSFATGEEIMPGVLLNSVAFDHIVVSNNGALEKLYLDQSVPAQTVGGEATVGAAEMTAPVVQNSGVKLNPETLANGVGLAERNENGKITGLVVSAKDDGSILKAAGLRDGDIVISINGNAVSSSADLTKYLRPGANVALEVERGAQKLPLAISLEKQ